MYSKFLSISHYDAEGNCSLVITNYIECFSFSAEYHVQGENEYVGVGASVADSTVVTNGGIYMYCHVYYGI